MTSVPPQPQRMAEVQRHFDTACGIASESEEHQISTLLYCLSEEAEDVLKSTNISDREKELQASLREDGRVLHSPKECFFERTRFT